MRQRLGGGIHSGMGTDAARATTVEAILERALHGEVSEDDARRRHELGPEAVTPFPCLVPPPKRMNRKRKLVAHVPKLV